MKLQVDSFRGEVPRLTPRALPENAAQSAVNARMQTGDLEAWRQHLSVKALANAPSVKTVYLLKDKWLSWNEQVDVARSVLPGDTSYRVFLTCPELYATPRFTDYALATTGAEPYPVVTRPLGVPGPDTAPTTVVGVDTSDEANFSVDILDHGDEIGTWTRSPPVNEATFNSNVEQEPTDGSPSTPCYQLSWRDYETGTYLFRGFGISKAVVTSMTFRCKLNSVGGQSQVRSAVLCSEEGKGVQVGVFGSSGDWRLQISTQSSWGNACYQAALLTSAASVSGISAGTWFKVRVDVLYQPAGTYKVTATALDLADAELGSLSTVISLDEPGDYCGFAGGNDQLGSTSYARLDEINVRASGTIGYAPDNTSTSYVYTFVNDLGQESAPSFASATILRPDGVSVTVTTPTTAPVGSDPDYGITTKRIYRSVSGAGGVAFLRVASIPLAQADFVDNLTDAQTGPQVLESEDWDLPPPTLEGIRALPNGIMTGFYLNQLCFSEQDRPHAWPVKYRKTTDTNIVGICNIDNTVVIGTESFVYTATGNEPGGYSMSLPGEAQACVSKQSMVFLDGQGVVFASPDGYQVCSGSASNVRNLTEQVFTRDQWQSYRPESIIAAVHDGVLHWFWDTSDYFLLLETGDYILREDGDKFILE